LVLVPLLPLLGLGLLDRLAAVAMLVELKERAVKEDGLLDKSGQRAVERGRQGDKDRGPVEVGLVVRPGFGALGVRAVREEIVALL
jgi:hypothetical protein